MLGKGDNVCIRLQKNSYRPYSPPLPAGWIYICPCAENGQVNYGIWSQEAETALDALNTVKSPKDFFFPQSENLYTCYREGKKISITPEELADAPFAIFGIRGCDVKGIEVLDKVFLADPVDKFYEARRNHGVLISMACHEPEETCFCKVFGVEAQNPAGDVTTWIVDDTLYWRANTEKGENLTADLAAQALLVPAEAGRRGQAVEAEQASVAAHRGESCPTAAFPWRPARTRMMLEQIQLPQVGGTVPALPGLRHLHLRLPHLPVLRHPGLRHRTWHPEVPLLGFLHVLRFHADGPRQQP